MGPASGEAVGFSSDCQAIFLLLVFSDSLEAREEPGYLGPASLCQAHGPRATEGLPGSPRGFLAGPQQHCGSDAHHGVCSAQPMEKHLGGTLTGVIFVY